MGCGGTTVGGVGAAEEADADGKEALAVGVREAACDGELS